MDTCQACSAHLYLLCRKCHHRNPRALHTCEECGARLKSSSWRRLRKWLTRSDSKFRPVEVLIALAMIFIFYKFSMVLINFFSNVNETTPQ